LLEFVCREEDLFVSLFDGEINLSLGRYERGEEGRATPLDLFLELRTQTSQLSLMEGSIHESIDRTEEETDEKIVGDASQTDTQLSLLRLSTSRIGKLQSIDLLSSDPAPDQDRVRERRRDVQTPNSNLMPSEHFKTKQCLKSD
jgi:hypothetical protein